MKTTLLALLLTVIFSSTAIAQEPCKRHVEPKGGFSFCPPDGWNIRDYPKEKFKIMLGPASDGFAPNLNVRELKNLPQSLQDVAAMVSKFYAGNPEGMGTSYVGSFTQSEFTTFANQPGIKLAFQSVKEGVRLRSTMYFFLEKATLK